MTRTVSDKLTDHDIWKQKKKVLNKKEIFQKKSSSTCKACSLFARHFQCGLDYEPRSYQNLSTLRLSEIMKQKIYSRKYTCWPASLLLTIRSSSFVISRGGTKAHFEGKIPEGYSDKLGCTNAPRIERILTKPLDTCWHDIIFFLSRYQLFCYNGKITQSTLHLPFCNFITIHQNIAHFLAACSIKSFLAADLRKCNCTTLLDK